MIYKICCPESFFKKIVQIYKVIKLYKFSLSEKVLTDVRNELQIMQPQLY